YFNLSFWYKLIDKTIYGALFSVFGCLVLLAVNLWGIPRMGYMACAWGGFAGYGSAMLLSYFVGQRLNPIPYPLRSMACYLLLACALYVLIELIPGEWPVVSQLVVGTVLVGIYAVYTIRTDMPLQSLPVIGKYFRKNKKE
ncbi:MAG: polysaccharide biosynthesis C-terminal domain-containing protein, partial [Bacteroidaceae bacterium]